MKSVRPGFLIQDMRSKIHEQAGFTFVELLVALGIFVIIVVAAYLMLEGGLDAFSTVDDQIAAQGEARRNIARMSKYIRECKQITLADEYELVVSSDIDDDNVPETVRFYLSDSNGDSLHELNQTVDGAAATELGRYVINPSSSDPIFTYFDSSGNQLADFDQAKTASRSIKIKLIVDSETSELPSAYILESKVRLRNFE